MEDVCTPGSIKNDRDILDFFKRVIAYRDEHKCESAQIARFAYSMTHENEVGFMCKSEINLLRGEMIALEAPGVPQDDTMQPEVYDNMLWNQLLKEVEAEIEKRIV